MITIRCAGYDSPRIPVDYGPRDDRVWLRACREKNCPDDRCLSMSWCSGCDDRKDFCACSGK